MSKIVYTFVLFFECHGYTHHMCWYRTEIIGLRNRNPNGAQNTFTMDKIDNAIKALINKQLEKYNVDFDYVMDHQQIDGKLWCYYFTLTKDEDEAFRKWAIEYLRKTFHWQKQYAEKEFSWYYLMYGLNVSPDVTTAP